MLVLRLVRTFRPTALARRALVAGMAGAVGFLLLSALGYAVAHPERPDVALSRLLWCAVPLLACAQFAASAARTDPCVRPREGLDAVGVGPARLPLLAALSTALSCAVGCAVALPAFLHLRDGLGDAPLAGAAAELLGGDRELPRAAVATLLAVPPLVAAGASAVATRLRALPSARSVALPGTPPPAPAGLPWGVAVMAVGLAVETHAAGRIASPPGPGVPWPGPLDALGPGVVGGWLLIALGLGLAGPGLVHLCGLLLAVGRPGALRLLAGRALREEAPRVGHSLGVLCAVVAGAPAAARLYETSGGGLEVGPLTALGAAVVVVCAVAAALSAAAEFRAARASATDGLRRLGASRGTLRAAAALRVAVLLVVLVPLAWLVSELAALSPAR
ncbi:hypothetical protein [Streptomyces megasporus]|uniref:hypothetical protein n=1 Tax=Streptomyces megasporus TaxID=44060 RepID=UPI0004E1CC10|nr:hypothetical protein [Streptomyces megasporus]